MMRMRGVRREPLSMAGYRRLWLLLAVMLLSACGRGSQTPTVHVLESIAPGDECHVCGMEIRGFPGPKAEVFIRGEQHPLKFCSTRDLFAFLLQPESAAIVEQVYVQDMATADWQHPGDRHFTDGRAAWYVAGHSLGGAMGPTLASFRERAAAESFAAKHGGRVLAYAQIDQGVMDELLTKAAWLTWMRSAAPGVNRYYAYPPRWR